MNSTERKAQDQEAQRYIALYQIRETIFPEAYITTVLDSQSCLKGFLKAFATKVEMLPPNDAKLEHFVRAVKRSLVATASFVPYGRDKLPSVAFD